MKNSVKKIVRRKMCNHLKILTYVARPEGLGLHRPILNTLSLGLFCNDALYELAKQGNVWATTVLFNRPNVNWDLCRILIYSAIQQNCIEQTKFILHEIATRDGATRDDVVQDAARDDVVQDAAQDGVTSLKNDYHFIYSFNTCIAKDYRDMVKVLLEIIPWNLPELNSYLYSAANNNKIEIAEMLIEKGAYDLRDCLRVAVMNSNVKFIEILINEIIKTSKRSETSGLLIQELELCLHTADNARRYVSIRCILNCLPNDLVLIGRLNEQKYWCDIVQDTIKEKLNSLIIEVPKALKSSAMDF